MNDVLYAKLAGDLRLRMLRPQTVEKYMRCVRAFDAHDPCRPLEERDRSDVRAWLLHLLDRRRLAPSTYLVHLAALRFLFTFTLARPEVVSSIPRPIRRPPRLPRVLDRAELLRLFDAAPTPVARLAFEAAYATGVRIGELCRLRRDDLRDGIMTVRDGKGGLERRIVAGHRLPQLVERLDLPGPWLIPARIWPAPRFTWSDRSAAPRTVSRWFRDALARAELPSDASFHGLRHAFASHLYELGVDVDALRVALGHRTLATTERYIRSVSETRRPSQSPLDLLAWQ